MTHTPWPDEPHLSADFAARVLHQVDKVRTRRRRVQFAMAAAAGALLVALIVGPRPAPTPTREVPGTIAANSGSGTDVLADAEWGLLSGDSTSTPGQDAGADALGYLFPDAAPLARFVDEYSAATDGTGIHDEALSSDGITSRGEQL